MSPLSSNNDRMQSFDSTERAKIKDGMSKIWNEQRSNN